jgi:hypothetical protein
MVSFLKLILPNSSLPNSRLLGVLSDSGKLNSPDSKLLFTMSRLFFLSLISLKNGGISLLKNGIIEIS